MFCYREYRMCTKLKLYPVTLTDSCKCRMQCKYQIKFNSPPNFEQTISTACIFRLYLNTPVERPKKKVTQRSLQAQIHQKHFQRVAQWAVLHENEVHKQPFPWALLHHVGSDNSSSSAPEVILSLLRYDKKTHTIPTWHLFLNSGCNCKLSSDSLYFISSSFCCSSDFLRTTLN